MGSLICSFSLALLFLLPLLVVGQTKTDSPRPNNTITTMTELPLGPTVTEITKCVLMPTDSTVTSKVRSLLDDGAKLLKYNLHLENEDMLDSKMNQSMVYKPRFWVRTTGRQGRVILRLRQDNDMLSLSTLALGVYLLDVNLTEHPRDCLAQLKFSEIEYLFRDLVMTDFKNRSSDAILQLGPAESVCNMRIVNVLGFADFDYFCCKKSGKFHTDCRILEDEPGMKAIKILIQILRLIFVLFIPNLIPESVFRTKHNAVPFDYKDPDTPIRLRIVKTNTPEEYCARKVCKLSKFRHMSKFMKTIQDLSSNKTHDIHIDNVKLAVKRKHLLNSETTSFGLVQFLYETYFKCKVRERPSVNACCNTNIHVCCLECQLSWYSLFKKLMKVVIIAFIVLPYAIFYYKYLSLYKQEDNLRNEAANEKGLEYSSSSTIILNADLVFFYLISLGLFVLVPCLPGSFITHEMVKNRMQLTFRKFFSDNRKLSQVISMMVQKLLQPFISCGACGICIACLKLILMLLIYPFVMLFYMSSTVNVSSRLFAQYVKYGLHVQCVSSCSIPNFIKKHIIEIPMDSNKSTYSRSSEVKEGNAKFHRMQQLLIVVNCLFPLYSCLLLLSQFVSVFVEILVYTTIGIIINSSLSLTFVSLTFCIIFYANDCFGNVVKRFISFSTTVKVYILGLGQSQVRPMLFTNKKQPNRAFRVETELPREPYSLVTIVRNGENEPRLKISKLVLFVAYRGEPEIPKTFFFETCKMDYSKAPGTLSGCHFSAFKSFGVIMIFLIFVVIVVLTFGESYKLSATNHLLATIAGGFLPLMFQRVLFKTHRVPKIDPKKDINFQTGIFDILNSYEECWPIHDIDVIPKELINSTDAYYVNTNVLDFAPTVKQALRQTQTGHERLNTAGECSVGIPVENDAIDLVIDMRDVGRPESVVNERTYSNKGVLDI